MGEENAYRLAHLHQHLAQSTPGGAVRDAFPDSGIDYGDGTGYCRTCGMNDPKHTSSCRTKKAGSVA